MYYSIGERNKILVHISNQDCMDFVVSTLCTCKFQVHKPSNKDNQYLFHTCMSHMFHTFQFLWLLYSCNKITMTQIQISPRKLDGIFSNISHQMMI
jgi:hypothetical protein